MKKQNKSFISRAHIIPKIICVLFAFIIWIYVMMVDSPDNEEVFEDIPVTVIGTTALENERNLSIFSGYDALVDVTVRGQKSVISKYSADDIVATVDVSKITEGGMYNLELFFDLPRDIALVESSVTEVSIFVDKRITENVQVKPSLKSYKMSSSDYALGDITCDTDVISITGPESTVKEVYYALVEVNMGDEHLTHSVTTDGNIILKNQNDEDVDARYLRLSKNTVQVTVPVYSYKTVNLKANTKYGLYTKDNAEIIINPQSMKIKGDPGVLENINDIYITTIDEKNIGASSELMVDITLPENVLPVEGEPTDAKVIVQLKGLMKKTFAVDNIKLINGGENRERYEIMDKTVAVTVMGDKKALENFTADDITLTVDLSEYNTMTGTIYPAATVSFNNEYGTLYELGVYGIQIVAN